MIVHPEFRNAMTAQRVRELEGAAVGRKRAVRRRVGLLLVAAGERLAPEAHVSARAPRRVLN